MDNALFECERNIFEYERNIYSVVLVIKGIHFCGFLTKLVVASDMLSRIDRPMNFVKFNFCYPTLQ